MALTAASSARIPASQKANRRVTCLAATIFVLIGLAGTAGCSHSSQSNSLILSADGSWQASLALPAGNPVASALEPDTILPKIRSLGLSAMVERRTNGAVLEVGGKGGLAEARELLYGNLSSLGLPFQPGTRLKLNGSVQQGQTFHITLEANPSTGFTWETVSINPIYLQQASTPTYSGNSLAGMLEGAAQEQTFTFIAEATGQTSLEFAYRRQWEEHPVSVGTLEVSAPGLADLSDLSSPYDAPVVGVPELIETASTIPTELPAHWDWREHASLPPARDQRSCGSCWAFATVGVLETNIAIHDGKIVDLSEQYLVSCNNHGWNCIAGGGTAHGYHYDTFKAPEESAPGAVLEAAFPYTASDSACSGPHPHSYLLESWKMVSSDSYYKVDVNAIKQAIYAHGPVKVSVCAGNYFVNYKGGVLTASDSCAPYYVNHAVVLVGWDDTVSGGIWYLRNSWGSSWGESGYMKIARGVSNVGMGASYVVYEGATSEQVYLPVLFR